MAVHSTHDQQYKYFEPMVFECQCVGLQSQEQKRTAVLIAVLSMQEEGHDDDPAVFTPINTITSLAVDSQYRFSCRILTRAHSGTLRKCYQGGWQERFRTTCRYSPSGEEQGNIWTSSACLKSAYVRWS